MNRTCQKIILSCCLLSFYPASVQAASTPAADHIHFQAEHLIEASQDARYYAMPWPNGDYSSTGWTPLVSMATARVSEGYARSNGQLLTLGVNKNWSNTSSEAWATEFIIFYDRFQISGGQTTNSLLPFALNNVPLDLPESAVFSNPDGEFIHSGLGIILSRRLNVNDSNWQWDILGSILLENIRMINFTYQYKLTGGLDAGATGVLDHSGDIQLIYYVIGLQAKKVISKRYSIIPRVMYGRPDKPAKMTTSLTGPGFAISTTSTGAKPGSIGDQFSYFGMTVADNKTGFEMDLGAVLGYTSFEYLARESVDSAIILSLTWRMR